MTIVVGITNEDGLTVSINQWDTGDFSSITAEQELAAKTIEAAIFDVLKRSVVNKFLPALTVIWDGQKIKVKPT